jgi:hypothetical protein
MENDGIATNDRVDHSELGAAEPSPEFTQTSVRRYCRGKREREDGALAGEKIDIRQDRSSVLDRIQVV